MMSIILLAAMLQGASAQAPPIPSVALSQDQLQGFDPVGSCRGADGRSVDLHRMLLFEDRSASLDGRSGPVRITIEGEDVRVAEADAPQRGTYIVNVGDLIDAEDDLDIQLKLAFVDGHIALYWRETYQHRFYRQGLFSIDPDGFFLPADRGLTPLCEGVGGNYSVR